MTPPPTTTSTQSTPRHINPKAPTPPQVCDEQRRWPLFHALPQDAWDSLSDADRLLVTAADAPEVLGLDLIAWVRRVDDLAAVLRCDVRSLFGGLQSLQARGLLQWMQGGRGGAFIAVAPAGRVYVDALVVAATHCRPVHSTSQSAAATRSPEVAA